MAVAGLALGLILPLGLPDLVSVPLTGVVFALAGYLLPSLWLEQRISMRLREIQRSLAEATDLLTLAVDCGLRLGEGSLSITARFPNAPGDAIRKRRGR